MQNSQLVWKNQKQLRTGYTTGSCAAAAAKAAARMLLTGEEIRQVSLLTPKGVMLYLDIENIQFGKDSVSCAVQKDSGDDPDVTNGVYVFAEVKKIAGTEILLDGGEGVGRVTRKGLEQEIGAAAINKVPRQMIREAVEEQCRKYHYCGGMSVLISIPEGAALAGRTFNPRLGIEGGISVLGTTGIVEPMSEKALIDTIYIEMKMLRENGIRQCYIVPGNYGMDFLCKTLGFQEKLSVKCSNYIGETLDMAVRLDMEGLLLIGHIGKLIKLAGGVMNTHSRQADCRMEILTAHAACAGADAGICRNLMECITTTEALDILRTEGILESVMESVTDKITAYLRQRAGSSLRVEVVMFSLEDGILGMSEGAVKIQEEIAAQPTAGEPNSNI